MLIGDPAQRHTAMEKVCLHRFPIKGGRRGAHRRITAGRTGMRHGHLFLEVGSMVFGRAVGQIKTTPQKPTTPPHFWKRRSKRDQRRGTWRERPPQGAVPLAQLSRCRENLPKQRHAVKDFFPIFSARERFLTLRRLQHSNPSKLFRQFLGGDLDVVAALHVHPELRRGAEHLGEALHGQENVSQRDTTRAETRSPYSAFGLQGMPSAKHFE